MKWFLMAVLVPALIVLGVGCGSSGPTAPGLALGDAPWKDGEKAIYDIVGKAGNKVGTSEFGFAKDGDTWVLSSSDKAANLDQSAKVRVDAKTLKPMGEEKVLKVPGTEATVNTTYKDGKLEIKAVVNGEDKSATIEVPANALDNDQLLMTLRALQFAEGYEGKYVNVVGQNALKIDTTVRVKGKEKLEVPAGSFETWRVELDFGQAKQHAWYQVEAPNHMVQYDNGTTKFVLTKR